MKKSLIALAVMAAVAGSAQAQSSITVYGVADMAIQAGNQGAGTGTKYALDSGEQGGSRLGFKGTEDLGSGLKAIFDIEMGILMDSGKTQGSATFHRQTWVGLQGDFGTVKLGKQYTPQFYFFDAVDPFDLGFTSGYAGSSTKGDPGSTSTGGVFGFLSASAWRVTDSVSYQSADMSGFSAMGLYGFGEQAGNTSANRSVGISGQYAAGPLYVGAVYYKKNDPKSNGLKSVLLGATYDFGAAKAAFGYSKDTTDDNTLDQKGYMLGVTVPVTAADSILATAARLQNNLASTANNSTQLAVGFTHSLSKRTNFYGSYSRVTNDANVNGGWLAAGNGATASLVNVGIHHAF